MIPTIRYAETLFLFAFAYYVARIWRRSDGFRSLAAGALGEAVPIVALAVRNQRAFGAFWRTGYSISGEQTGFGIGNFVSYFFPYLMLLLTLGAGAVFVVGVWGMIVLCQRHETRLRGQFLVALVLPITLLYMAYYHRPGHNSTRFLLPTFFVYTIAAVSLLKLRTQAEPARGKKLTRILLAFTVLWGLPLSLYELQALRRDNAVLASVTRDLRLHVEPGSILIAQSGLQQHLDFVGGWRLAPQEGLGRRRRPSRPGGPPGPRQGESPPFEEPAPTEWGPTFLQEIARWAGDRHKVYWLTTPGQFQAVSSRPGTVQWVKIAEIRVTDPHPPPPAERDDRHGEPPRGPRRPQRGQPRGPARFEVPSDGTFLLVEWKWQRD